MAQQEEALMDTAHPIRHALTDWPWKIPLRGRDGTVRAYTLVDESDYEDLSRFRWSLIKGGYVRRTHRIGAVRVIVRMHRQLLGLDPGDSREGDHINGDTLDNRRANLRVVSRAGQQQNRPSSRGSTSAYRGVSWAPRQKAWKTTVQLNGKSLYLGYYKREEDAAAVTAAWRAEHMPFSVEGR